MNDLKFWVRPSDSCPYEVDLTEFSHGGSVDLVPTKSRVSWAEDYRGRPGLADDIYCSFKQSPPSRPTLKSTLSTLRTLFRFLDEIDPECSIASCLDLNDGHGSLLRRWVEERGLSSTVYKKIRLAAGLLRECRGGPTLFWPVVTPVAPAWVEDFDEKGFQRLYLALKKEARSIVDMFAEGTRLAEGGSDPRCTDNGGSWGRREDHAYLVRELTRDRIPYKSVFIAEGAQGLHKDLGQGLCKGPSYIAPGMTERATEGIVGKLRWFHPSFQDTTIILWLFLIGTGWNLATALAIDVTDESSWLENHPQDPGTAVLHAFKDRASRHVFALSLRKPQWHPYGALRFILDRTAVMRATVRERLAVAEALWRREPSDANAAEVGRLAAIARSPWLYHVVNKVGEIGAIQNAASQHLNDVVRIVVERHGLAELHPFLANLVTTDARDAWIGHAYAVSGHNALIARMAAQHGGGLRTLMHYLRRRRYRAQSEASVRRVQDAAFDEIGRGAVLDPTRIRLLVEQGSITPEQERRLLDRRQRTRVGMGCLDPRHPPRQVAPDHVEGSLCRVQRCTGCQHGVVFADSVGSLARAHAELIHIKRTIPLSAWSGSSFEDEELSIEQTLEQFDASQVQAERAAWLERLYVGEVLPHDTYPSC